MLASHALASVGVGLEVRSDGRPRRQAAMDRVADALLADEPTAPLERESGGDAMGLLRALAAAGGRLLATG